MRNPRTPATVAAAVLVLAALAGPASARKSVAAPHYLAADGFDWRAVVDPGPPAGDSAVAKAELATVLHDQAVRTPADVDRCRREDGLSPWLFADVLGDGFAHRSFPATDRLLRSAEVDALYFADTAKERWERPRPPAVDGRVHPCVGRQLTGSYPSSHAARGIVWATLLAEVYPDRKQQLLDEGKRIGDDRVIAGIHFPSDVAAGQKLGAALAERLLADPGVRADLAKAKAEAAATPVPVH